MEAKTRYWLEISEYDLVTAEAVFEKKRFVYVGFMCHQAIEKVLKAYWQSTLCSLPPKTHNLAYLIEKTGLLPTLPASFLDFIDELDPLNIQCRYPEYKEQMYRTMDESYSLNILNSAKDLHAWLKTRLS